MLISGKKHYPDIFLDFSAFKGINSSYIELILNLSMTHTHTNWLSTHCQCQAATQMIVETAKAFTRHFLLIILLAVVVTLASLVVQRMYKKYTVKIVYKIIIIVLPINRHFVIGWENIFHSEYMIYNVQYSLGFLLGNIMFKYYSDVHLYDIQHWLFLPWWRLIYVNIATCDKPHFLFPKIE